jgi:hypothetical protein
MVGFRHSNKKSSLSSLGNISFSFFPGQWILNVLGKIAILQLWIYPRFGTLNITIKREVYILIPRICKLYSDMTKENLDYQWN